MARGTALPPEEVSGARGRGRGARDARLVQPGEEQRAGAASSEWNAAEQGWSRGQMSGAGLLSSLVT